MLRYTQSVANLMILHNLNIRSLIRYLCPLFLSSILCAYTFWLHSAGTQGLRAYVMPINEDAEPQPIKLPFRGQRENPRYKQALYVAMFDQKPGEAKYFLLVADDCWRDITVNGKLLPPDRIESVKNPFFKNKTNCDYNNSSRLDLSGAIGNGRNNITVTVTNTDGKYGFDLRREPSLLQITGMLCVAASIVYIVYAMGFRTAALFVAAFIYYMFWLHYRPNNTPTNDLWSHLAYIRYMSTGWMRPYDYWGHEYWHPPVYYFVAGMIKQLAETLGFNWITAVRFFSVPLLLICCIFGVRTLREAHQEKDALYYLGVFLILFWPLSLLMATRVNNDIALYATWSAAFYYLMRWYNHQQSRDLQKMFIMLGLSFMIKTNALLIAAVAGAVMAYALCRKRWHIRVLCERPVLTGIGILAFGLLVNIGRVIFTYFSHKEHSYRSHLGEIGDHVMTWKKALSFDLSHYLAWPYNKIFGEPTFLNNLTKTMLFSEYSWRLAPFAKPVTIAFLTFLLMTLTLTFISIRLKKRRFDDVAPYLIAIIIPTIGLLIFTILRKMSVCQDFRFIFPSLIAYISLFIMGLASIRDIPCARFFYWMGIGIGLFIPLGGMYIFLGQYWW
jgi:Ca2+/Na+ antiporter